MESKLDVQEAVRELEEEGLTEFHVDDFIDEAHVRVEKHDDVVKGSIYLNLDFNTKEMKDTILAGSDNVVGVAAQGVVRILEHMWDRSPDLEATKEEFAEGREAEYVFRYPKN